MKSYKTINDENKLSHHIRAKSDRYNSTHNINSSGTAAASSLANITNSSKIASGSNCKSTRSSDSHLGSLQQREVLSDLTAQENYKSRLKSQQQQQPSSSRSSTHQPQPPIHHSHPYAQYQSYHQRSSSHDNSNSNSSITSGVSTAGPTLTNSKLQIYKQAAQNLHHNKKPRLEKASHKEFADYTDEDLRITSDEAAAESSDDKENRLPSSQYTHPTLHVQHQHQHQNSHLHDLHNRIYDDARHQSAQHLPSHSHDKYEMHFKEEMDDEEFTDGVPDNYVLDEEEFDEEDNTNDDDLRDQMVIKQSITRDSVTEPYSRNDDELQTEKEVSMETTIKQGDSSSIHEEDEAHHHHHQQSQQSQQSQVTSKSQLSNTQKRSETVTPMKPSWDLSIKMELKRIVDKYSRTTLDENDEDTYDASMVAEYAPEIFNYMRSLEEKYKPNPYYMDVLQDELRWGMRAVLIDWVVQVHGKFNLLPETLFLTVNYIDRFLSKRKVSLSRFQLVGAVAFFIAAKYEEINCPTVQEVAFMADNAYTIDEFLKAERFMVDVLEFDMGWPGPMSFLRRTSKADDYDYETRTLAKYFLEITIMDARFVASPPSWLAAGAHYLSRVLLSRGEWTEAHVFYSGYTERQLRPLAEQLLENCRYAEKNHKAIFEKYSERRYRKSSLFVKEYFENF
ncbi:CLB4 [Candida theae]|uniref:CLB4 n=1 Tax=Candida theae TaxID=1198502 RepID=A0AAD5G0Z1_9ASCO|nr:CLB4 [Candida theae]KAI5967595.1 CLB4 [Candida theae]